MNIHVAQRVISIAKAHARFLTFVFKIDGYYRHELWKDYKNSEYTGTLLKHGTDRNENFRNNKKIILKTAIKSFESRGFFWICRLTANKQYFNLGLTSIKNIPE
jgi:hypothetical protein